MIDLAESLPPSTPGDQPPEQRQMVRRRPALTDVAGALVPDRLPPHALEAEQGVLGCILMDPVDCLAEFTQRCRAGAEVFYDLKHQVIIGAMLATSGQGAALDLITLQQHLKDNKQLEAVGGIPYLMSLADATPSSANLPYYLDILIEKFVYRQMIRVASGTVAEAHECEGEGMGALGKFESQVLAIRDSLGGTGDVPIKDVVNQAVNHIEALYKLGGKCGGLTTGFPDLDRVHDGLHPDEMIVIPAYPSTGKTALLMNIADHVAVECGHPVGIFSLEMSEKLLVLRMICARAKVNLRSIRDGFLAERDFPRLTVAATQISKAPLYLHSASGMSIHELRAKARRWSRLHGIKVFGIDYLQLLTAEGSRRKFSSPSEEHQEVSRNVKGMARELKATVLALSQLNDEGKIKGSRAASEDGDSVWYLRKPKRDDDDDEPESSETCRVDLDIAKQRNGPAPEKVELVLLKGFTRFESVSKVAAADVPQTDWP